MWVYVLKESSHGTALHWVAASSLFVSSRGVASVIIMASEMRYVDGIPVVPKHTAMIDFLELCQSGATLKSVTLDSEMRKSSVDGSWALIETEESGLSSRVVVEKIREAIIENEEGDPDFVWAIVEPADAVVGGIESDVGHVEVVHHEQPGKRTGL